jgi:hypothetical protein
MVGSLATRKYEFRVEVNGSANALAYYDIAVISFIVQAPVGKKETW